MPTLVDIAPFAVTPPRMGGQTVIHDVNAAIARMGWRVEQFSLGIRREDLRFVGRTRRLEVAPGYVEWRRTEPLSMLAFMISAALRAPNAWSDIPLRLRPWRELEACASRSRAVLVETPWAFAPARPFRPPGVPLVYMSHNVEFQLASAGDPDPLRRPRSLAKRARSREAALLQLADLTICITPEDGRAISEAYGIDPAHIAVVPRGLDLDRYPKVDEAAREKLRHQLGYGDSTVALFVGSRHGPNRAALDFMIGLAKELGPVVRCVAAGSIATVVEPRDAEPLWLRPGDPSAHLVGADIALNPMSSGSGMNIKMLEYFAAGLPVVTTPMGRRGIQGKPGEDFLVAELEAFPAAVKSIIGDPLRARAIGAAGRRLAEASYSADSTAREIIALVEALGGTR